MYIKYYESKKFKTNCILNERSTLEYIRLKLRPTKSIGSVPCKYLCLRTGGSSDCFFFFWQVRCSGISSRIWNRFLFSPTALFTHATDTAGALGPAEGSPPLPPIRRPGLQDVILVRTRSENMCCSH